MLENYSLRAQQVVSMATIEAQQLDHPRVGTEHLLLGLLSGEGGASAEVLLAAGASLAAARHMVAELVNAEAGSPATEVLPMTSRAERALDRASRFARQARAPEVTAEHVLLGVLDVEGLACQVLRGLDIEIGHVRDAIVNTRADAAPQRIDPPHAGETVRPRCPRCRSLLDGVLVETLVAARRDDDATTDLSVVHCAACGTTLGVMRRDSP